MKIEAENKTAAKYPTLVKLAAVAATAAALAACKQQQQKLAGEPPMFTPPVQNVK